MAEEVTVEQVRVELVRGLRAEVLRPGLPPELSIYESDGLPDAQHFAAWSANRIVGVASIHPESLAGFENLKAWRLRGMAVDPQSQDEGVGSAILRECVEFVKLFDADVLWCNGRETAWNFYRRLGFKKIGEPFDIPESGEHFVLLLQIK